MCVVHCVHLLCVRIVMYRSDCSVPAHGTRVCRDYRMLYDAVDWPCTRMSAPIGRHVAYHAVGVSVVTYAQHTWLAGWSAGWLAGWLAGRLVGWSAGWLADWLAGCPAGRLAGWMADLSGC